MEDAAKRRRLTIHNQTNKENECELSRHIRAPCDKDLRERMAQQQLSDISEIDWRRVEAGWHQQHTLDFWDDISGWNQPPSAVQPLHHAKKFRSSSELKPKSAGRARQLAQRPEKQACNTTNKLNYRTSTVSTMGDEVLVCKPVATEPAEHYVPTDNNIVFEHRQATALQPGPTEKAKPREEPSKLYDIIKSIEVENGKLLRKLFKDKSINRQPSINERRQSLRSAGRPASGVRRHHSKESFKTSNALPTTKADEVLNFVLCSQKGIMPSTTKQDRSALRGIRKELFEDSKHIFYPCGNTVSRFALRTKLAACSIARKK